MIPAELDEVLKERGGGAFYLHGADEEGKERFARKLVEAHLDPATRDFNFDPLRGGDVDAEHLASVLGTPPMMAPWRVVLLRETQALSSSPRARELLVKVATDPPPGLALVLLCTVPLKSSARFYRDLEGAARSLEFQAPEPHDLPGWLMERCRESFGRELEEDAARALSQAIGADLSILVRELEKLSTLVDEGERITREVVERAGTKLPRQDRWRWFDLVGIQDFERAARGLPILLEHGETGVGLVSGLGTHLLRVGLIVEGGASALTSALPPNQRWIARRIAEQARGWTREELQAAIRGLLRLDELLKSSRIPAVQLLEGWLLERMVQKEAAA